MKYTFLIIAMFSLIACRNKSSQEVTVKRNPVSGQVLCIKRDTGIFTAYRYTPIRPPWNGIYDTTYIDEGFSDQLWLYTLGGCPIHLRRNDSTIDVEGFFRPGNGNDSGAVLHNAWAKGYTLDRGVSYGGMDTTLAFDMIPGRDTTPNGRSINFYDHDSGGPASRTIRIGPGDQDSTIRHIGSQRYLSQIGGNSPARISRDKFYNKNGKHTPFGTASEFNRYFKKQAILQNGEEGVSDTLYLDGSDTAYKEADYKGNHYKIMYAYNSRGATIPFVSSTWHPIPKPDKSHYLCTITVFMKTGFVDGIIGAGGKSSVRDAIGPLVGYFKIGDPFIGIYVPGGCFEDVPVEWIKKAISTEKESIYIGNGGSGRTGSFRFLPGKTGAALTNEVRDTTLPVQQYNQLRYHEIEDSFIVRAMAAEPIYIGNTHENMSSQRVSSYNGVDLDKLSNEQRDSLLATLPSLEQLDSLWTEADSLIKEYQKEYEHYQADSTIRANLIIMIGYKEDTIRNIDHITVHGFLGFKKTLYHVPGLIKTTWYGQKKDLYYYLNGITRCPVIKIFYNE